MKQQHTFGTSFIFLSQRDKRLRNCRYLTLLVLLILYGHSSCLAEDANPVKNELFRVRDAFFLDRTDWLQDWKLSHGKRLQEMDGKVLLLLICWTATGPETTAILAAPLPKLPLVELVSQNPPLVPAKIVQIDQANKVQMVDLKTEARGMVDGYIREIWEMASRAAVTIPRERIQLDSEVWYIVCQEPDESIGYSHSSGLIAQAISPDKFDRIYQLHGIMTKYLHDLPK